MASNFAHFHPWEMNSYFGKNSAMLSKKVCYIYPRKKRYQPFSPNQVGRLKLFVMGFRGDWKSYVQVFNLVRHPGTDEVRWTMRKMFKPPSFQYVTTLLGVTRSPEGLLLMQSHQRCLWHEHVFHWHFPWSCMDGDISPRKPLGDSTPLHPTDRVRPANGCTGPAAYFQPRDRTRPCWLHTQSHFTGWSGVCWGHYPIEIWKCNRILEKIRKGWKTYSQAQEAIQIENMLGNKKVSRAEE